MNISEANTNPFVQGAVVRIIIHPDYNERQHYADVALLVLDRSVRVSTLKLPFACLPDEDADPTEAYGTVLGWGHDNFGGRLQTHLQEARIPIISTDVCNTAYRSLGSYDREFPKGINHDFICAGNITDGGVDACQVSFFYSYNFFYFYYLKKNRRFAKGSKTMLYRVLLD